MPHDNLGPVSDALVGVLGPVEVTDEAGRAFSPASASQRRLLALLASRPRRTIRAEVLADQLGVSPGALRTTVSRLRRTAGPALIHTGAVGYRLDAEVDAERFTTLFLSTTDDPEPLGALDDALRLWRGDAYEEFRNEAWTRADVARLDELRAVAIERRAGALVAQGRFGEAVADLESLVLQQPLRGRTPALLMEALLSDGRRAEALRVYQRHRSVLAELTGIEPSPDLQRLERSIVVGGPPDAPTTTPRRSDR